jgi:uncharacterized protein (TIGR04141 family)
LPRSRSFSIYLLKSGFDARNALRADHGLEDQVAASDLPAGAILFVLDASPRAPWWRSYFGIRKNLNQVHKGALVFLPAQRRCFALAFGHVAHNLKETSYEYDFGLRVTLNCLDPKKLRSTDILEPGAARRQRTQMPVESDLTFFDFDRDSTILRSLTGKVSDEYRDLFRHATGASNLRISSNLAASGLPTLCENLLSLYESENYKTTFPDIQNISPVRDPSLLTELNSKVVAAFRDKDEALSLAVPDIINYRDNVYAAFAGAGQSELYDDVFIGRYYEYLENRNVPLTTVGIEQMRKHSLVLTDENGLERERFSVYRSLVFDTASGNQVFHLSEGNWYRVELSYVEKLEKYLDPLCVDLTLPPFKHKSEGAYNKAAAAANPNLVCLDMTNIAPAGQSQVEPCDLYEVKNGAAVFQHVKCLRYRVSLAIFLIKERMQFS